MMEQKGSEKVLDPDSPSALAAVITIILMGTGTGMWLLFVQQMGDVWPKHSGGTGFVSGFDTDFLHNVEQITLQRKRIILVRQSGVYSISVLERVWFLETI